MTRRRFTERQTLECAILHGAVIPCGRCKAPFTPETIKTAEREHPHEVALGGEDTPQACFYSHRECHAVITRGSGATTAGSSIGKISKTKRIIRENKMAVDKPPTGERRVRVGHRIPSRPFQSGKTKWPKRAFGR